MQYKNWIAGMIIAAAAGPVVAEESATESCQTAAELYEEGKLTEAIEEARWCLTLMEQDKQGQTASLFVDEVNGYVGGEIEQQQAMGFNNIERDYRNGDKRIRVALSSGASGAMANAFSAIAQMGMSSGQGKAIRIQRRKAFDASSGDDASIQVTLNNGGILQFDSSSVGSSELVEFAEAFPVADIDDSLE